jgi:hypothetical protein
MSALAETLGACAEEAHKPAVQDSWGSEACKYSMRKYKSIWGAKRCIQYNCALRAPNYLAPQANGKMLRRKQND